MNDTLPAATWKAYDSIQVSHDDWWRSEGLRTLLTRNDFRVCSSVWCRETIDGADAVYSEYRVGPHDIVIVRLKTEAVRLWAMMNTRSVNNVGP